MIYNEVKTFCWGIIPSFLLLLLLLSPNLSWTCLGTTCAEDQKGTHNKHRKEITLGIYETGERGLLIVLTV
jgi:hypothetical protein